MRQIVRTHYLRYYLTKLLGYDYDEKNINLEKTIKEQMLFPV